MTYLGCFVVLLPPPRRALQNTNEEDGGLGDLGVVVCRDVGRGEEVEGVVEEPFLRDSTTDKLVGPFLGLCW